MIAGPLLALVLCASPPLPSEVRVEKSEGLSSVARRVLGDAHAATELKALNGLTSDQVPAGTTLKLPGPDRALAVSALAAARNAVAQAASPAEKRAEASARLKEAEALFQSAKYSEAAKAADAVWALVSARAHEPTRFTVQVDEDGRTQVASQAGKPVRVEAEGVAQPVYPGQELAVVKGQPPPAPLNPKAAVTLLWPDDAGRVKQTSGGKPAQIKLSWQSLPGARSYEVVVTSAKGSSGARMTSNEAQAMLPSLPGKYQWWVRALLREGAKSEPSIKRSFELIDEPLRLEVGKTQWK